MKLVRHLPVALQNPSITSTVSRFASKRILGMSKPVEIIGDRLNDFLSRVLRHALSDLRKGRVFDALGSGDLLVLSLVLVKQIKNGAQTERIQLVVVFCHHVATI